MPLQMGRYNHRCGRIKSDSTGTQMSIIAVGGIGQNGAYLSSVEVLNDGSSQWTPGPELPDEIHSPAIIQDPNGGVILIGGHSKFIRICHLTVSFFKLEVICLDNKKDC